MFLFFSLFFLFFPFFLRQLGCLHEGYTLYDYPGHLQGEVFTQGSFIFSFLVFLFFLSLFSFLGGGWSGGRDLIHY